jgi:phage shock protein PspC (stress-responsive transcriptional regulator)
MVAAGKRPHHGPMSDIPPSPPRAGPGHRFVREPEDRLVGGVCSGLSDALGVDVALVRTAAVVAMLFSPWLLIAYVVALVVIPERPADEPRVRSEPLGPLAHVSPAVLVIGVIVAIALVGEVWWLHPVPAALALVGVGLWLVTRDHVPGSQHFDAQGAHSTTIPADAVTPPPSDATAEYARSGPPDEPSPPGSTWLPGATATFASPPPAPTPRPAPAFFPIVGAILLIGGGLLWLADSAGAIDVGWRGALAAALVVVGVTLVFATWWGRAAGLIPVAVLLATLLVVDEALAVPVTAGIGERTVVVDTAEEVVDHQQLLIGDLTVDLSDVPAQSGSTQDVEVSVGIGELTVIVPRDAAVTAEVQVRGGDVDWPGVPATSQESGVDVDRTFTLPGEPGAARLHLDLSLGLGDVEVRRG